MSPRIRTGSVSSDIAPIPLHERFPNQFNQQGFFEGNSGSLRRKPPMPDHPNMRTISSSVFNLNQSGQLPPQPFQPNAWGFNSMTQVSNVLKWITQQKS